MARILTSLHGKVAGLDRHDRLIIPAGYISGEHGSQIALPSPTTVTRFDDFTGGSQALSTTIIDGWRSRKGTTNTTDWTVTEAVNGTAVGTIGDTTASMAVSGVQLDSSLDWKANQGNLCFEARVKMSQITTIAVYIGLTDQVAALEMPVNSAASADTITTNASDGCGFMFDTSMATDDWWLVGVAANTDATLQDTGLAPTADTYETFRIELSTTGVASFFRNGKRVGTAMSGATTATVALTPVVAGFNRTTSGTPTLTVDYIHVSGARV